MPDYPRCWARLPRVAAPLNLWPSQLAARPRRSRAVEGQPRHSTALIGQLLTLERPPTYESVAHLKTTQASHAGNKQWRATLLSAAILSMAGLGDSFLYPTLPLQAGQLGVPVIWIGVLLSINKFVRLGGNYGVALGIGRLGYKRMATISVALAALSTLLYGVNPPVWIWILSRLAWGMAYASLRLCALGYATEAKQYGVHLGISRAIQEIGPMAALFIGPVIAAQLGVQAAFLVFGFATALAFPLTLTLPRGSSTAEPGVIGGFPRPSWFDGLTFTTALADGVLTVTVGLLLLNAGMSQGGVLAAAALFLALKRLSGTVIAPISGWLSDRWNIRYVYLGSVLGFLIGLSLISLGATVPGVIVVFMSNAVGVAIGPGVAIAAKSVSQLNMLSTFTTWRDIGTACGALVGGYVLMQLAPGIVFGTTAAIVVIFTLKSLATPPLRSADHPDSLLSMPSGS